MSLPLSITARNPRELAKLIGLDSATAAQWELRIELVTKIAEETKKLGLTHAEVAKRAKTSRARITSIINRNFDDVSTDLLLRVLTALGYRVEVRFSRERRVA